MEESNKHINSYINPIEAFKREGNYSIKPNLSNKECYEVLRNRKYAAEGRESQSNLSKNVSKTEFNELKKSLPILPRQANLKESVKLDNISNNNKNNLKVSVDSSKNLGLAPLNNKSMKFNDPYFYKNISGNPLKNEHYYASKRQA